VSVSVDQHPPQTNHGSLLEVVVPRLERVRVVAADDLHGMHLSRKRGTRIEVLVIEHTNSYVVPTPCLDANCKLSETKGHRLLKTQRPQMLWLTAWVWFSLTEEFVAMVSVGLVSVSVDLHPPNTNNSSLLEVVVPRLERVRVVAADVLDGVDLGKKMKKKMEKNGIIMHCYSLFER